MPDDITAAGTCQEISSLRKAKLMTYKLSQLYEIAGMPEEAKRCTYCSTFPTFGITADGTRHLLANNSCRLRLCPVCTERRARNMAHELSLVMETVALERPQVRYVFLTLTVENIHADQLRDGLRHLTRAWNKLMQHADVKRAIGGWFRATEITRERQRWNWYHPHLHAILAVEPDYFLRSSGKYLTHEAWLQHWQQALDVSYRPSVQITKTHAKGATSSEDSAERAAALEAAKYTTKSADYIESDLPLSKAAAVVRTYTAAIKGQRLHAYGGWLADAARTLKAQEAAADTDRDRTLRGDLLELIENYNWSFGAKDYILLSRTKPPVPAPTDAIAPADTPEQLEIEGMPAPQTRRPV